MRDFLKKNPHEILFLKFQTFKNFGTEDYFHLMGLLRGYFTFSTPTSKCNLVTLTENTGKYIARETVGSLLKANKRVFLIWEKKDVPTDTTSAGNPTEIWNHPFAFTPSLTLTDSLAMWDPYWDGKDSKLGNDESTLDYAKWWNWHRGNLDTWAVNADAGLFVLQSQMQVLSVLTSKGISNAHKNNKKNIERYIEWAGAIPMNIMTFNFVDCVTKCVDDCEDGGSGCKDGNPSEKLVQFIISFYERTLHHK
jgi:hypothetical protein